MTATIGLVSTVPTPHNLATFWSEALGYTTAGDAGNYVLLVPTDTGPPKLLLQLKQRRPRTACTSTSKRPTSMPK